MYVLPTANSKDCCKARAQLK